MAPLQRLLSVLAVVAIASCLAAPVGSSPPGGGGSDGPSGDAAYIFSKPGPVGFVTHKDLSVEISQSTGCAVGRCRAAVTATVPLLGTAAGMGLIETIPLVLLSPGFLVPRMQYIEYAERLASWGFAVLLWEPTGERLWAANTHKTLALMTYEVWAWALGRNRDPLSPLHEAFNETEGLLLVGHSRGAKANCLASALFPGVVRGVVNLDPVDSSPFTQESADYPSALPLLRFARAPMLSIGSQLGNESIAFGPSCAPNGANWASFYEHSRVGWYIELLNAGHMQFLGGGSCLECPLLRSMCRKGSQSDAAVRGMSMTAMTAWLSTVTGRFRGINSYVVDWALSLEARGLAVSGSKGVLQPDDGMLFAWPPAESSVSAL
mmetsp:Transcript_47452/g.115565  ORF Transcript_47452/g.115565 Transcript_47452/m.115565 type:complete len:378 (+) Transcript_47452:76-1209(+)